MIALIPVANRDVDFCVSSEAVSRGDDEIRPMGVFGENGSSTSVLDISVAVKPDDEGPLAFFDALASNDSR